MFLNRELMSLLNYIERLRRSYALLSALIADPGNSKNFSHSRHSKL